MVKEFRIENVAVRYVLLPLIGLSLLIFTGLILKWCLASAASANVSQREVAEALVFLAPDDPSTHVALARVLEKSFLVEDFDKAIEHYKKALELSPQDYRLWLELGVAIEKYKSPQDAEKFLRKAEELAPNYSIVYWNLGNNLLRQGKTQEALEKIKIAAEKDEKMIAPAVNVVFDVFDGDFQKIFQIVESAKTRLIVALTLAKRKRFDEAFSVWNEMSQAEKQGSFIDQTKELSKILVAEKKFHLALKVLKQIDERLDFEEIKNPSFEDEIRQAEDNFFDWKISDGMNPQIGVSRDHKKSGEQSLTMVFDASTREKPRLVEQLIAVFPNKQYRLSFFFRSNFRSQNTVRWEVVDANGGKLLAQSEYLPTASDWKSEEVEFSTSDATEAVTIRISYPPCFFVGTCSISGRVWFDDFGLKR